MKRLMFVVLLLAAGICPAQEADQAIADAKAKVAMKLMDPESAHFADVAVSPKGGLVCGWVNAKNSFGGYVGYKPFYVFNTRVELRDDASAGSLNNHISFDTAWGACFPDSGESFGNAQVVLAKVDGNKYCAKITRAARGPLGYDCPKYESDAKTWLEAHGTSPSVATKCAAEIRVSGSYWSGQRCVKNAEMEIIYDRGPRVATQAVGPRFKCVDTSGKTYVTTTPSKGCVVE